MKVIRIGTRKSALALTQTEWVASALKHEYPRLRVDVQKIVTKGDRIVHVTLSKVGGKGLFVKEIEQALLNGAIDVAVHSMKDVPGEMTDGLTLAAVCKREDPRDCIVSREGRPLAELPRGAVVGTSSLRRQAQIKRFRPDLRVEPVRGNIDTRLRKMRDGQFDAIVLAAAGLHRMGWSDLITEYLDVDVSLPAVGQGAIGLQCRADDEETIQILQALNDEATERTVAAERAFLKRLGGSCHIPVAAFGELVGGHIRLTGLVANASGSRMLTERVTGEDPERIGRELAEQLIGKGAGELIASLSSEER